MPKTIGKTAAAQFKPTEPMPSALTMRLEAPRPQNPAAGLWMHTATQRLYRLLHLALMEHDQSEVAVYESMRDGRVWIRPRVEFFDGRFQRVVLEQLDLHMEPPR